MDCHEVLYRHLRFPEDESHFFCEMSQKLLDILQIIFSTDIRVALRMNYNHFGERLTLHLVPSAAQN